MQKPPIRASWFVSRVLQKYTATHSICWALGPVQSGAVFWHTNLCMTSMRWLLRWHDSELCNLKQVCHKSTNFIHNWLKICTIKILISRIYLDSSSIIIPTNLKHNCWWIFVIYACPFSGLSLYPITAWKPTTECRPNRLKLEQIGRWE